MRSVPQTVLSETPMVPKRPLLLIGSCTNTGPDYRGADRPKKEEQRSSAIGNSSSQCKQASELPLRRRTEEDGEPRTWTWT